MAYQNTFYINNVPVTCTGDGDHDWITADFKIEAYANASNTSYDVKVYARIDASSRMNWNGDGDIRVTCNGVKKSAQVSLKMYGSDITTEWDGPATFSFGAPGEVKLSIMVPTEAYRDEGTSYHYAPASDYIEIKNADTVAEFMESVGLPYVKGKTWTTDAVHRETKANFEKRKADGCISVEMECAAVQAMCDFRGLDAYFFFTCGDLLDSPQWDARMKKNQIKSTQHDSGHFDIALELARYIVD